MTDTTKEISQEAARAMLAALLDAQIALEQMCIDQHEDNECWMILVRVNYAIALAEGRVS